MKGHIYVTSSGKYIKVDQKNDHTKVNDYLDTVTSINDATVINDHMFKSYSHRIQETLDTECYKIPAETITTIRILIGKPN